MKILIIGGFWDEKNPKPSTMLQLVNLEDVEIRNGGTLSELQELAIQTQNYDLVIWMPNIQNIHADIFPIKKTGGVLIVSKVLRENRSRVDAIQRIFKFHGNATIALTKTEKPYVYELIDALNNTWIKSSDFEEIVKKAQELTIWTISAIREETRRKHDELDRLLELNKRVADEVRANQERFFGNISTRCMSLFPSFNYENGQYILVSARNTDKQNLTRSDMIVVCRDKEYRLTYLGDRKPSVDSPVQMDIYTQLPYIKYMIHGHNQVIGAETTEKYYPCGDKREVQGIIKLMSDGMSKIINLKNHGFLIMATTLDDMEKIINEIQFKKLE